MMSRLETIPMGTPSSTMGTWRILCSAISCSIVAIGVSMVQDIALVVIMCFTSTLSGGSELASILASISRSVSTPAKLSCASKTTRQPIWLSVIFFAASSTVAFSFMVRSLPGCCATCSISLTIGVSTVFSFTDGVLSAHCFYRIKVAVGC